jgi:hypothetical protein
VSRRNSSTVGLTIELKKLSVFIGIPEVRSCFAFIANDTINGKLSALRWVLGDEWDSLDTYGLLAAGLLGTHSLPHRKIFQFIAAAIAARAASWFLRAAERITGSEHFI